METINVKRLLVKVYPSNARQRRHKREFEQKEKNALNIYEIQGEEEVEVITNIKRKHK